MNHQRIYNLIIENAIKQNRKRINGYIENHHILPKCLGGTDDKSNLVALTAKEHYLCHKLLCEIYPTNSNIFFAYWCMCKLHSNKQERYFISAKTYDRLKHDFSKFQSERTIGKIPWNKGKTYKNPKVSEALKGNVPWNAGRTNVYTKETLIKMSIAAKNKKTDPEVEAKRRAGISRNGKGYGYTRYKKIFDTRNNTEYESVNAFLKTIKMNRVKYKKLLDAKLLYFI